MCGTIYDNSFAEARNGSILAIGPEDHNGKMKATVVKSTSRKFPIGHQVTLQNDMGHVLCKGEEETGVECELHPLDAIGPKYGNGPFTVYTERGVVLADVVASATREALRRRRYNNNRRLQTAA